MPKGPRLVNKKLQTHKKGSGPSLVTEGIGNCFYSVEIHYGDPDDLVLSRSSGSPAAFLAHVTYQYLPLLSWPSIRTLAYEPHTILKVPWRFLRRKAFTEFFSTDRCDICGWLSGRISLDKVLCDGCSNNGICQKCTRMYDKSASKVSSSKSSLSCRLCDLCLFSIDKEKLSKGRQHMRIMHDHVLDLLDELLSYGFQRLWKAFYSSRQERRELMLARLVNELSQ